MAELSNPDHFETILDFAFGIADRGLPLSLVLMEPDGWPDGSESPEQRAALEELAADVAQRTRRSDRVTRISDTLFAILLVDCNRQGALIFADRLQISAGAFSSESGCTVSLGIASYAWSMKVPGDLLQAARGALGAAQERGGDRIELHEPPMPGKTGGG